MDGSAQQQLHDYFKQFPSKTLRSGQELLQPGQALSQVYFLEQGYVRQYVVSEDGVELTHHLYKPGSFFPLLLSLNHTDNRFYFEAFTEVTMRVAPISEVVGFLKEHPDLLVDLNRRLLAGLNGLLHRIETITFGTAQTRVANGLLFMVRHFGQKIDDHIVITQPFTHKNLSHLIGLTRETTSLELEKLVQKQIIDRQQGNYVIIDHDKLESIARF